MRGLSINLFLVASLLPSIALAAFNAAAKTNVITYWGQGANQDRLLTTCQNPSYDIINIGFVDVFPDEGAGGFPGTNFGNACWGDVYENNGVNTSLLKTCPYIGPDVIECQQTYGKKIFLSLGGGYPTSYYIKSDASGRKFADFLWAAFGPVSAKKKAVPRPWGDAGVDGFDFDIENLMDPALQANYMTSGYAAMISRFKNTWFPTDTTKQYYISGAPQCPIPDSHLSDVLATAWFDFFTIQFYNTPGCSARDAINKAKGQGTSDISYANWTVQSSLNPNVKMSLGLPGSPTAAVDPTYYLIPSEIQSLVRRFYKNVKFGGIMLWEATAAQNNKPCNVDYGTWMKSILNAKAAGTTFNTNTKTCAGFSTKRALTQVAPAAPAVELRKRRDSSSVIVTRITATYTTVYPVPVTSTIRGKLWTGTYDETTTVTMDFLSTITVAAAPSSAQPTLGAPVSSAPHQYPQHGHRESSAAAESTYTSVNVITVVPIPVSSGSATSSAALYSAGPTSSASSSAKAGAATGGSGTQSVSLVGLLFAGLSAILLV